MNPDSERLLAVARRLIERCPAELGREIAVTGSVGAGLADSESDIELLLLDESVPSPEQVRGWLEDAGATDVRAGTEPGGVWGWGRLDGAELDPFWARTSDAAEEVDAITSGDVLDHSRLAFAHVLTHSIPLRTAGVLDELVRRCAVYPEGLSRRLIEDALDAWRVPASRLGAIVRGDVFEAIARLQGETTRVLRIVFALNERWEPPRWKWIRVYADDLAIAPPSLADRVKAALATSDLAAASRASAELALDVLDLLPASFDVDPARRSLQARMDALTGEPAHAGNP